MTTYQDPPLQSRRAVRQGERPEQSSPPFAPPQAPRTAAGVGEPLSYVTQNRPLLPGYEQPPQHGRRAVEPEHDEAAPQAQAESPGDVDAGEGVEQQGFRPRDFSPEARTAPPAWRPSDDRESGVVEYHTQARANVIPPPPPSGSSVAAMLAGEPAVDDPSADEPAVEEASVDEPAAERIAAEHTLTRRELRALRDAQGITAAETMVTPVVAPRPERAQSETAKPETPLDAFRAPADGTQPETRRGRRAALAAEAPQSGPTAFDSLFAPAAPNPEGETAAEQPAPEETAAEQPAAEQAAPEQPAAEHAAPEQPVPPVEPAPQAVVPPAEPAPLSPATSSPPPAAEPASAEAPAVAPPAAVPTVAPTTGERPAGHWTTQSDLDDRMQGGGSISRTIGSGAITTSALVLPSLPGHDMSTGEVMLTDSVALPSALSSTGAHSPIDESDIDHLLDPGDQQLVNTDSVPISAFKAVSSHTGNRNLIATGKPHRGNRALTALIISASGMVVVVVTLLVVALATEVI